MVHAANDKFIDRDRHIRSRSRKMRSAIRRFLLTFLLCGLIMPVLPAKEAQAYDEITRLEVTVGYFGSKEYHKASPTLSEIENNLDIHQEIYTGLKGDSTPRTIEAEGVYIEELIAYCGVEIDSVDGYNFFTQDAAYAERTKSWTYDELFADRYTFKSVFYNAIEDYNASDPEDYMRHPERHYTIDNIFDASSGGYTREAWNEREEVEPMLALHKNAANWKSYNPESQLDFENLDSNNTPILYFGQKSVSEQTAGDQAQMISKINIRYEGEPEITVDEMTIEGEAGTQKKMVVHVITPDETLTDAVLNDLQFKSSNDKVASVDKNGTVTILGEGNASISVVYNGKVYGSSSATGNASKSEEPAPDPAEQDEDDKGSGDGSGSGSGNGGSGGGSGNTDGSGSGSGNGGRSSSSGNGRSSSGGSTGTDKSGQSGVQKGGTSSFKSTGLSTSRKASSATARNRGGVASGQRKKVSASAAEHAGRAGDDGSGDNKETITSTSKVYEITPEEAEEIAGEPGTTKTATRGALWGGLIAIAAGAVLESGSFKNQTRWVKHAKKVYGKKHD